MNTEEDRQTEILAPESDRKIPGIIMGLSWPAILEQFLVSMATLMDTAMVGSIGAVATAAVAVNISSVWLINGCITALSAGISFLISHSIGEGDPDKTRRITCQAITCSVTLGALLTLGVELVCRPLPLWLGAAPDVVPHAQRYMQIIGFGLVPQALSVILSAIFRCSGNTRLPLAANLTANAANVAGNFLLIYPSRQLTMGNLTIPMWGAGLGTSGAALATAASQYLLAAILLWMLAHQDTPVKIPLLQSRYHVEKPIFKQIWRIGFPVLLERLTLTSGQIALTAMISTLGTIPLAAHYLTNQTESLLYLPAYGFSYTATALVGQALGAGKKDLAAKYAYATCLIGSLVIVAACIPVAIFSRPIISLFSSDLQVIDLATQTLAIAAATELFFSFFIIACGVCRGSGDVRFSLLVSIIGMWGFRIGLVYLATRPLQMGIAGVWIAIAIDCLIRMILCIWRLKSGKWMHS